MLNFLHSIKAVGLEWTSTSLYLAEVSLVKGQPTLHKLETCSLNDRSHVKRLYINQQNVLATGLDGADVLIRQLELPLVKSKDIEAALSFQVEPLLPYTAEEAVLTSQLVEKEADSSRLTVFSVRKPLLQKHLEQAPFEPEVVSSTQGALAEFSQSYLSSIERPFLIIHVQDQWTTCLLMHKGHLLASYSHPEGFNLIRQAHSQSETLSSYPLETLDLKDSLCHACPLFNEAIRKLQQAVARMTFALSKDIKEGPVEGILVTGEIAQLAHGEETLISTLSFPLLEGTPLSSHYSTAVQRRYAIPIGLSILALKKPEQNFRQQEFSYSDPWHRLKQPLAVYFILSLLLTAAVYFFGLSYLQDQENQLKQDYVDLLTSINKPYEQFETAFLTKNPIAREKTQGEILNAIAFDRQDLQERLEFLQRDLQATPETFPLFANIPLVSDVLAWLSQHPNVIHKKEDGSTEPRLQLENFSYLMLKRPVQGKKQEKYQVRVEIEFTSPNPTWAREFHDALIAPNDFVDPKGEVKWSSNRGKYRTSFFLKDKTNYPS